MSEREEMVDSLKYLRERRYFLTDVKLRVLKRNVATAIWLRVMVVELLRKETTQGKRCDNRSSIKVRGNKNILERMEEDESRVIMGRTTTAATDRKEENERHYGVGEREDLVSVTLPYSMQKRGPPLY